jgi:hypothetical protein
MELVLQAPSITLEQPKRKVVSVTRQILRIDNLSRGTEVNFTLENMSFARVSVKEAINQIQVNDSGVDAVLVSPESITADIVTLKEIARKKSVPVILYTPTYEPSAKKTAFTISADE